MSYRLPDSSTKALYIRRKFGEIAGHYDLFNDLVTQGRHRHWKQVLVDRLELKADARGLDLCCGTGDIALRAGRKLSPAGMVAAMDFAPEMLRVAKKKLGQRGGLARSRSRVLRGDAMRLPFADGSLGFVTLGFGLRNVTDPSGCLEEIFRVLAPGGVLDMGKVASPWLSPLVGFYLFRVAPLIGRLLQPGQEMFDYLPHSTSVYPGQGAISEMLRGRGFGRVELIEFLFGATVIHLAHKPE